MQGQEIVVFFFIFFHVAMSWTVDLPEVRRQHFKHGTGSDKNVYDNVENNSKLTDENVAPRDIYRDKYADDYEYLGYREKELNHDNIEHGNQYLEGLRKSIDQYAKVLEYCQQFNYTQESARSQSSSENESEIAAQTRETCERATLSKEHVRRLAELAVYTTKQLQDLEFEERYRKKDEEREKELLMKLAFFLDELAHYTGFVPHPEQLETETTTEVVTTTSQPLLNLDFLQVPEDVRNRMISCLKMNGSEPATEKCAFPLPLPPILRSLFNLTDSSANDSVSDTAVLKQSISQQSSEPATSNTSPEAAVTAVKSDVYAGRTKRSIDDDPLQNVLQYYIKYHTWLNSNLKPNDKNDEKDFNVENDLKKSINKRSVDATSNLRNSLLVIDDLNALKAKRTESYNEKRATELILDKIRPNDGITTKYSKLKEQRIKSIKKRSIHYENPIRPIISQDPYQDISNYIKRKAGVNYNPSLSQAAQVRAGLETAFQNGNIEVVRRYGSNVNPLVPFPFYFGIIQSLADI